MRELISWMDINLTKNYSIYAYRKYAWICIHKIAMFKKFYENKLNGKEMC